MNTRTNRLAAAGAVLITLAVALPAVAHHGTNISYDRTKAWTKPVVVSGFNYANPHPQLFFVVQNDAGAQEKWSAELLPNPAQLIRNGWSRKRANETLKPGTKLTLTIAPGRAGGTVGLLLKAVDATGTEIITDRQGGVPPAADQPPPAVPAR